MIDFRYIVVVFTSLLPFVDVLQIFDTYDGDNDERLNERELAQFLGHDLGFVGAVADAEAKKILEGNPTVDIARCIAILVRDAFDVFGVFDV